MTGADTLDGGSGSNTATYEHSAVSVLASLTDAAVNSGDASGDNYINIQHLVGSAYADTLIGDSGVNTLTGGDGNDTLEGMAGADILIGGSGNNTASYEHATAAVYVSLANPAANSGDARGDSYSDIQNLIGSAKNDTLIGNSLANNMNGGAGFDTVTYSNSTIGITVSLSASLTALQTGDATGDTFTSIEKVFGTFYDDTLIGDSLNNQLFGGGGNDILEGMAGGDALYGNSGINTASYEHSVAVTGVTASLTNSAVNTGDAAGDSYTNIQCLTGSAYNDTLTGDVLANTLNGGMGDDNLDGAGGADNMYGGSGSDTIKANYGPDSAYGGDNNDTFYVSSVSTNLPTVIDGGARDDIVGNGNVVVLQDLVTGGYTMATLATKLNNIDTLNIKNAAAATALTISSLDVRNMVDNATESQLYVKADSGDMLNVSLAAGETMTTTVIDAAHTDYTVFNASNVQIAQIHWNTA